MEDEKVVDVGVVWAAVAWGVAVALCVTGSVIAIGWHADTRPRMVGLSFMAFGLLAAAVAAVLSVRVIARAETRYFIAALRLAREGEDGRALRQIH